MLKGIQGTVVVVIAVFGVIFSIADVLSNLNVPGVPAFC
jgi:hypothetical protein